MHVGAFLPVAWAIVATIIGLVLYKSSEALFEQTRRSSGETRRIRLVGSVVIAAVAFGGMKYSTPSAVLDPYPADSLLISKAKIQMLLDQSSRVEDSLLPLGACLSLEAGKQCQKDYDSVLSAAGATTASIRKVLQEK